MLVEYGFALSRYVGPPLRNPISIIGRFGA